MKKYNIALITAAVLLAAITSSHAARNTTAQSVEISGFPSDTDYRAAVTQASGRILGKHYPAQFPPVNPRHDDKNKYWMKCETARDCKTTFSTAIRTASGKVLCSYDISLSYKAPTFPFESPKKMRGLSIIENYGCNFDLKDNHLWKITPK